MVYEELLRIAEGACPRDLPRFPNLQRRLAASVLEFIQARTLPRAGAALFVWHIRAGCVGVPCMCACAWRRRLKTTGVGPPHFGPPAQARREPDCRS
jgi:hypothetical protein